MNQDEYITIERESEGVYKESGSRFLSLCYPVSNVESAMEIIAGLKKKYHDATHHCYAYRIGKNGETYRINDDGEPSSTAGRPIYNEILSAGVSDILVVVVRWFGGVKLGVPGLIRAYKSAAKEAIANATKKVKTATLQIKITFEYQDTEVIMKALKRLGGEIVKKSFESQCMIEADLPISQLETIKKMLNLHSIEIDRLN